MTSREKASIIIDGLLNEVSEHTGYYMEVYRVQWVDFLERELLKKFEEGRHVGWAIKIKDET